MSLPRERRAPLSDDERRVFQDLRARVDAGRQSAADVPPVLSDLSPDEADEAWEASLEDPVADESEPASAQVASVSSGPPGFAVASVWRRAGAAAIDAACSIVIVGLVTVVSEVLWLRSGGRVSAPVSALAALFVLSGWVHVFVGEALFGGATLASGLWDCGLSTTAAKRRLSGGSSCGVSRWMRRRLWLRLSHCG